VLADVGERLLDDPVGGEVDPRRQRPGGAIDRQGDRQARGARLVDEVVDVREPRLWVKRGALVAGAQDAEHAAHLPQCLPTGGLGGAQRGACGSWFGAHDFPGRADLHDHHPDAVSDHVVQLARDPRPLFGDSHLHVLRTVARQSLGSSLEFKLAHAAPAEGVADRPAENQQHVHAAAIGHAAVPGKRGDVRGQQGQHRERDDARSPPGVDMRPDRVVSNQDRVPRFERHLPGGANPRPLHGRAKCDARQHRDRIATTPAQRHRHQQRANRLHATRTVETGLREALDPDLGQAHPRQHRGD
jgi:hypothetical protein